MERTVWRTVRTAHRTLLLIVLSVLIPVDARRLAKTVNNMPSSSFSPSPYSVSITTSRGTLPRGSPIAATATLKDTLPPHDNGGGAWLMLVLTTITGTGELVQGVDMQHKGRGRYSGQLRTLASGQATARVYEIGNRAFGRWTQKLWEGNKSFFALMLDEKRRCMVSKENPFGGRVCDVAKEGRWGLSGNKEVWCELEGGSAGEDQEVEHRRWCRARTHRYVMDSEEIYSLEKEEFERGKKEDGMLQWHGSSLQAVVQPQKTLLNSSVTFTVHGGRYRKGQVMKDSGAIMLNGVWLPRFPITMLKYAPGKPYLACGLNESSPLRRVAFIGDSTVRQMVHLLPKRVNGLLEAGWDVSRARRVQDFFSGQVDGRKTSRFGYDLHQTNKTSPYHLQYTFGGYPIIGPGLMLTHELGGVPLKPFLKQAAAAGVRIIIIGVGHHFVTTPSQRFAEYLGTLCEHLDLYHAAQPSVPIVWLTMNYRQEKLSYSNAKVRMMNAMIKEYAPAYSRVVDFGALSMLSALRHDVELHVHLPERYIHEKLNMICDQLM